MFNKPVKGVSLPFRMPNILGRVFNTGPQPFAPGETATPYGTYYHGIPWPNPVATINALANFAGLPRDVPVGVINNAQAPYPHNYLYFEGYTGKSRG